MIELKNATFFLHKDGTAGSIHADFNVQEIGTIMELGRGKCISGAGISYLKYQYGEKSVMLLI
jgi:hypothetical protein